MSNFLEVSEIKNIFNSVFRQDENGTPIAKFGYFSFEALRKIKDRQGKEAVELIKIPGSMYSSKTQFPFLMPGDYENIILRTFLNTKKVIEIGPFKIESGVPNIENLFEWACRSAESKKTEKPAPPLENKEEVDNSIGIVLKDGTEITAHKIGKEYIFKDKEGFDAKLNPSQHKEAKKKYLQATL